MFSWSIGTLATILKWLNVELTRECNIRYWYLYCFNHYKIVTVPTLFRLERPTPMQIELESGEETKVPTVAEARARFDQVESVPPHKISRSEIQPKGPPMAPMAARVQLKQKEPVITPVPEFMPKKVVPPAKKPDVPKPAGKQDTAPQGVKSPSPRSLIKMFINSNMLRNFIG